MLTTPDAFADATCLILDFHTSKVLNETPHNLTRPQIEWFRSYCDLRFRWFHANRPDWQKWLENRNPRIDPRGQCHVWIRHWLAAYLLDPAGYQVRCACCPACGDTLG